MSENEGPKIAESLRALDAEWFTTVLREGGHTEAAVSEARVEPVAFTGATTDLARVRLSYADDGAPGPASAIAKIRGVTEIQLGMDGAMGLFDREGQFYAQFADQVPVSTPTCYAVGDGTTTPLLLEDLGGLRVGDQMEGLTNAEAERMIDVLADMHTHFWGSPAIDAEWMIRPAEGGYRMMVQQLVASGADNVAKRFEGQVPGEAIEAMLAQAPDWGAVLDRGVEGPQTLAHNDCRLDNVLFREDGEPVFVDWQVMARTRGTADVANMLAGSMESQQLTNTWKPLVERYHAQLVDNGISGYSLDECIEHYRQSVLYPLGAGMAVLGAMPIDDGRGLGDVMAIRALRHAAELDSFASV